MTQQNKETLASVYNMLASLIPVPSEEYSSKHAFCLQSIRELLKEDKQDNDE